MYLTIKILKINLKPKSQLYFYFFMTSLLEFLIQIFYVLENALVVLIVILITRTMNKLNKK